MNNAYDIIIRPVISERAFDMQEFNRYTLEVHKDASKIEIAKAVSEIFKVKVEGVNTINVTGKVKRMGRFIGKRSDYKKAIVKLAAGETIEFFEA